MQPWVQLFGYLAWPITILVILFVARHEIRNILKSLEERLREPGTTKFTAGPQGITLETQLDAIVSQVESLQSNQDQLTSLARPGPTRLAGSAPTGVQEETRSEDIPPELLALAKEYLDISDPNWRTRLDKKNQYVQYMTDFVISRAVSRDALANSDNQGLLVALAGTVQILPEERDLQRLLGASRHVNRLHVKYRFVLAFTRLIEKDLVSNVDIDRIQGMLDKFQQGADKPLQLRIQRTRAFIEAKKSLGV